ncbi:MAG: methylated-DNA--[protein]-cysteine S-methyltransferase [Clostridiales bacterium]|jgi:methylated-DNA-protein-cysteine methyltransferase-like protein|nr:methylated-DNA--[protein]-cysteine S-methyltransferase [Clostridiales bacterium]
MEPFHTRVYRVVSEIPRGRVSTYGQVAFFAGSPGAARAVGWVLRRCPFPEIPCHRVINAQGALAADEIFGGEGVQRNKLLEEGILFLKDGRVDLSQCRWSP